MLSSRAPRALSLHSVPFSILALSAGLLPWVAACDFSSSVAPLPGLDAAFGTPDGQGTSPGVDDGGDARPTAYDAGDATLPPPDSGSPDATVASVDGAVDAAPSPLDGSVDAAPSPPDALAVDSAPASDAGSEFDANEDGASDAGSPDDAAYDASDGTCDLGSAASFATDQTLSVFGTPTYFDDGGSLPAGEYRVTYLDGCMMYGPGQGWTVNAYDGNPDSWWLIGATTDDRIVVPPGTTGYAPGAGAYANFDDCVAASQTVAPVDFYFDGGLLGVWLEDSPYSDNTAGPDGGNPRWELTLLGNCSLVSP